MTIENIPWFLPEVDSRETQALAKVIETGYLNDGNVTREFEKRIADLVGVKHCVAVTSGTAAISLSLLALGIGPGDEVIVPAFTFIATANAVRMTGAEVKLVDIESKRLTLDLELVRQSITPRTKAIVPVDVNGRGANYQDLIQICRDNGLALVTDSAEALGSHWNNQPLGSFGDAGCFSFSPNKTVTTGQGGMITTNSDRVHEILRELKDQGRRVQGSGGDDRHPVLGFNFKLTNLQAAVGLAQLDRLHERLRHAQQRDDWYRAFLKDCKHIAFPESADGQGEICQWTDILTEHKEKISNALQAKNIGSRNFWFPLHWQKTYACAKNMFPVANEISQKGLWLPSSFSLTETQAKVVCSTILELF